MVWQAAERDGFVADVQAMRRRVVEHIPAARGRAAAQARLRRAARRRVRGPAAAAGARPGRRVAARAATTLSALAGARPRAATSAARTARRCTRPTRFLRTLEHRIQLYQLRRTHVVPDDEAALRRLGRSLGLLPRTRSPSSSGSGATTAARCAGCTRSSSTGRCSTRSPSCPGERRRLTTEAAPAAAGGARLPRPRGRAAPPRGADHRRLPDRRDPAHPAAGDARVVRRRARPGRRAVRLPPDQRRAGHAPLVPQDAPRRGRGRRAARPRARPPAATPPTCSSASPQGVRMLGGATCARGPRRRSPRRCWPRASRHDRAEDAVRAVRAVRRRELFRIAAADALGPLDVAEVGAAPVPAHRRDPRGDARRRRARPSRRAAVSTTPPTRMAVVAMGRYGGFELSYGSDADVMFVHEPLPGVDQQDATSYAQAVANELRRLLALPGGRPAARGRRRPAPGGQAGAAGAHASTSYAAYYAKWSQVWEAQALLRADAVVGDEDLRAPVHRADRPAALPRGRASRDADVVEVRRIKARVDDERLPRGADPAHPPQARPRRARRHRVDRAAAPDAARRHASPGLRTPRTLAALAAARGRRAAVPRGRRDAGRGLAAGEPGPQRGDPGARPARRPAAARRPRAGGGGRGARLPRRGSPTRWSTTTCGPPGARTRSCRAGLLGAERATTAAPSTSGWPSTRWPRPGRRAGPGPGSRCRPGRARPWSGWSDGARTGSPPAPSARPSCSGPTPRSRASGPPRPPRSASPSAPTATSAPSSPP